MELGWDKFKNGYEYQPGTMIAFKFKNTYSNKWIKSDGPLIVPERNYNFDHYTDNEDEVYGTAEGKELKLMNSMSGVHLFIDEIDSDTYDVLYKEIHHMYHYQFHL